jgi:Flp pilus assembly protein TadD
MSQTREPVSLLAFEEHAAMRSLVGELDYAERVMRDVVRARPEDATAAKNLAIVLLSQGNYREGSQLYEARLRAPRTEPIPNLPFPRWTGEALQGRR